MKRAFFPIVFIGLLIMLASAAFKAQQNPAFTKNSKLSAVLNALGDKKPIHAIDFDEKLAEKGKEMFLEGRTTKPNGKRTNIISKHFQCTSCHNTVIEDPDITKSDPEARLQYAVENNLPFLQGTTVYGITNRESWYNGDYYRKYGSLVEASRDTLENAIQLCAVHCAQGRALDEWEMQAMLQYFWSLEYKLQDLSLSQQELNMINEAINSSDSKKSEALELVKSKYLTYSPATFIDAPVDKSKGYALAKYTPNIENGKHIYKHSCQHCHAHDRYTHFILDNTQMTFNMLENHLTDNGQMGVYWVLRYGTQPLYGYKPYMPHYTAERMSKEQSEDLVAFIKSQALGS